MVHATAGWRARGSPRTVGAGWSWPWRHSGGSALGHVVLLRLLYLFGDCLTSPESLVKALL
jgi:hypothetical protein